MKKYVVLAQTFIEDVEDALNIQAQDGYQLIKTFDVPNHFYVFIMEKDIEPVHQGD